MASRSTIFYAAVSFFLAAVALVAAAAGSPVDDDLTALRRLFPTVGPGLRTIKGGADGNYYILAAPNTGAAVFDAQGKQLRIIGNAPREGTGAPTVGFGEDCDVDQHGNVFIADRASNSVVVFSPAGAFLRSIAVMNPLSVAALPEGEVAVTAMHQSHLVTVYGPEGRVAREFGDPEELATRDDLNRYLNIGRVRSDREGRLYYGFTYMPEPLVRQFDRFGYAGVDFAFTGLDAFPEASALRKEIVRQEKRADPPIFRPVLTAFGVDPVGGDLWMALHNTLLHFDKDGNRQSEYRLYTKDGVRIEATVLLVEENRLLIGADPLGIYEFERPDRKR